MKHHDESTCDQTTNNACEGFELRLNECLDGRAALETMGSDSHLLQCQQCKSMFAIFQQFEGCGAAVLGGGATGRVGAVANSQADGFGFGMRSRRSQRWASSAALAVVAAILVLLALPLVQPENEPALVAFSPMAIVATISEVSELTEAGFTDSDYLLESYLFGPVEHVAGVTDWSGGSVAGLWSAVDSLRQPSLEQIVKASEIPRRLLVQRVQRFSEPVGRRGNSWFENPWLYTAELPGIRPLHRSVSTAALIFCQNDMVSML